MKNIWLGVKKMAHWASLVLTSLQIQFSGF
jgi:hypothetical protein